jgi:purine-binding chemotaxis protein CheW
VTATAVSTLYGVFRAGGLRMALPLEEVREVIVRPAEFSPLPTPGIGLLGAVNLRHTVIPVLDPRQLAGRPPSTETGEVVVIVSSDGQLFGLLADAIEGSTHVAGEALLAVHVGGGDTALFSHTFERGDDHAVIALLDAAAILEAPGIPAVADPARQADKLRTAAAATAQTPKPSRTLLMFECGSTGLCFDVMHVHSVVPDLVLHPSPLDGPICHGVAHLGGNAVPAIDPITLLGLRHGTRTDAHRGVVIALPNGLITLTATDVTDIATVPADDILPIPALRSPDHKLLAGLLTMNGRQYLVIDGRPLRTNPELGAFAALNMRLDPGREVTASPQPGRTGPDRHDGPRFVASVRKFLTYSVGAEAATPLEQIDEILPYPSHHLSLDDAPLVGMFTHRRTTIPLIDLPGLLSRPRTLNPDVDRVLLVTVAAGITVGLVVPELHAIEQSVEEESEATGGRRRLVSVGTPDENRLLPFLDLIAQATEYLSRHSVE